MADNLLIGKELGTTFGIGPGGRWNPLRGRRWTESDPPTTYNFY